MKICFVIQGMKKGGAERVASELCNWFVRHNNDVSVILTECKEKPCYYLDERIKLIYLEKDNRNVVYNRIGEIKQLVSNIKREKPDITISFITRTNVYSILACRLLGKKIIVSERNDPARDPKGMIMRILRRLTYKLADGIVCQTEYAKAYFPERIRKKSVVISNPIAKEVFEFEKTKPLQDKIVGVGRLEKQKNFQLLINSFCDIMEAYPSYKLVIYGQGSERKALEELIESRAAEGRVILFGQTDELFAEISDAKVFVLSSDYEGMPNVLAEAMALGLGCISTDCPAYGSAYLIDDMKNGILVKLNDREGMTGALKRLIEDECLRIELSSEAMKVKHKLNIDTISDDWMNFVNNVKG